MHLHEELALLNKNMNYQGIPYCEKCLIFYTGALAHRVDFADNLLSAKFLIARLNRFHTEYRWEVILGNGTMEDAVNTLNTFGPFLSRDQAEEFWKDVDLSGPFAQNW